MPLSRITNPVLANGNNQISFSSNTYSYSAGAQTYLQIKQTWDSAQGKPVGFLGLNTLDPNRQLHLKGMGSNGAAEITLEAGNTVSGGVVQSGGRIWNFVVHEGTSSKPSNIELRRLNDASTSANAVGGFICNGTTGIFSTTGGRLISPASVPAGSIIQVVQHSLSSIGLFTSSGNSSELDVTNSTRTFTPQYSNSRVLHIITIGLKFVCDGRVWIRRGGVNVSDSLGDQWREMAWDATVDMGPTTMQWIDSPATTSQISYSLRVQAGGCGNVLAVGNSGDFTPYWTMMEIAV